MTVGCGGIGDWPLRWRSWSGVVVVKLFVVVLGLCLVFPSTTDAGVTDFQITMDPQSLFYERFAIYSMADAPFGAVRDPYGIYNLNYQAFTNNLSLVSAELLIIHTTLWDQLGYYDELTGETNWCCEPKWQAAGICDRVDRLIMPAAYFNTSTSGNFYYYTEPTWTMTTNGSAAIAVAQVQDWRIDFVEGGVWYMLGVNCAGTTDYGADPPIPYDQYPKVLATGRSLWMNSVGYLSGLNFGNLGVYWTMVILLTIFGIVWLIVCVVYRKDLMGLQRAVGLVIVFSLGENLLWGIDYYQYNLDGINSTPSNVIGALLTASKTALSRVLLLLVAIGYSITKPELPKKTWTFVALVTAVYFCAVAAYQYTLVAIDAGAQVSDTVQLLIMILYVLATVIIFAWIFFALFQTHRQLVLEKQTMKLSMYKKLSITIGVSFAVTAIIFLMQAFIELLDQDDEYWMIWWLFDAIWEFTFYVILVAIAIIWRPSTNNKRYAYMQQLPDQPPEGDEELADVSLNTPSKDNNAEPKKSKPKAKRSAPKPTEKESSPDTTETIEVGETDVVDELAKSQSIDDSESVKTNPFIARSHAITSPPLDVSNSGSSDSDSADDV